MRFLPTTLPFALLVAIPALTRAAPARAPAPGGQGAAAMFDHVTAQRAPVNSSASRVLGQARLAPVPEPAIWAMMLAGIGFAGASLRRKAKRTRISVRR
jgi:hypothetical protein